MYKILVIDDDPSGTDCDMRGCAPAEGRFAFTAYAAGSSTCEDDDFESNDSSASATEVTFDSYGEWYNWFLKICANNLDYFRMNIPADHKEIIKRMTQTVLKVIFLNEVAFLINLHEIGGAGDAVVIQPSVV